MRNRFAFFNLIILLLSIVSCDKNDLVFDLPKVIKKPTIETNEIISITAFSANGGGSITYDGGENATARGVCYATISNPTTANSVVNSNTVSNYFSATIQPLLPNTTYYLKAFASNSAGIGYGNEISFKTLSTIPTITTATASNITSSSASTGGNVTSDGGVNVTSRGICFSTSQNPTIFNTLVPMGMGAGAFAVNMIGLQPFTTYYLRAYATNSVGIAYGAQINFTTSASLATLTTNTASSITTSSAISGGNITSSGGTTITSRGVCWSSTTSTPTISNPKTTDGSGLGSFSSSLTGLSANTTYYVRSYASNGMGTSYGNMSS